MRALGSWTLRAVALGVGLWIVAAPAGSALPYGPGDWTQVGEDGLGDSTNESIDAWVVYDGLLVAGGENETSGHLAAVP